MKKEIVSFNRYIERFKKRSSYRTSCQRTTLKKSQISKGRKWIIVTNDLTKQNRQFLGLPGEFSDSLLREEYENEI